MALPKVNTLPKYEMTIPSNGKKVKFRPYLVKEEKAILIAMETGDASAQAEAILDSIIACVDTDIDRNTITPNDVEWMFLQLRSKSVGETIKVSYKCTKCEHPNANDININDIQVTDKPDTNIIEISPEVSVEMGWPTYNDIKNVDLSDKSNMTLEMFGIVARAMRAIIVKNGADEERINCKDETQEGLLEFLDSLTTTQFTKLFTFLQKQPKLTYDIKFTCEKCQELNEHKLEGMRSFFM